MNSSNTPLRRPTIQNNSFNQFSHSKENSDQIEKVKLFSIKIDFLGLDIEKFHSLFEISLKASNLINELIDKVNSQINTHQAKGKLKVSLIASFGRPKNSNNTEVL